MSQYANDIEKLKQWARKKAEQRHLIYCDEHERLFFRLLEEHKTILANHLLNISSSDKEDTVL
jgi:DNA transposition AAA+ family ATPase